MCCFSYFVCVWTCLFQYYGIGIIIFFLLNFLCELDSYESTSWVYDSGLQGSHEFEETFESDNLARPLFFFFKPQS